MFGGPGYGEILLILLIVLLLFGAKRIPEIAQGLGKGIREFRRALHEVKDEIESTGEEDEGKEHKELAG